MNRICIVVALLSCFACNSNKTATKENTSTVTEPTNTELKTEPKTQEVQVESIESTSTIVDDQMVQETEVQQVQENQSNSMLIVGKWAIVSISEKGKTKELPYEEWKMHLVFSEEGNQVGIKSACNSGSCSYLVTNDDIKIETECGFTEMYCAEEIKNEWERKLLQVLHDQTKIVELGDENMVLNGSVYGVKLERTE